MDKAKLQYLYVELMKAKDRRDWIVLAFVLERLGEVLFENVEEYKALRLKMSEE